MGRKKKKQVKPWCWYCNREFEDEKVLIQHQKAKHFKCATCGKKLFTVPGLTIHCNQVHKQKIDKIPNALPNRTCIDIEIYGMEGIPESDLRQHEREKLGVSDDEPKNKIKKLDNVQSSTNAFPLPTPVFVPPVPPIPFGAVPTRGLPTLNMTAQLPIMSAPQLCTQKFDSILVPSYSKAILKEDVPKVPKPSVNTNGMTIVLKHPLEDVSLEERKANLPRYKGYLVVKIPRMIDPNTISAATTVVGPFIPPPPGSARGFPFPVGVAPPPPPMPTVPPFNCITQLRPPIHMPQITSRVSLPNLNPFFMGGGRM